MATNSTDGSSGTMATVNGPSSVDKPDSSQTKRSEKKTSTTNRTGSSLDRIGSAKDEEAQARRKYKFRGTFFNATRSPRPQYFTIHPEWGSECLTQSQHITQFERYATFPPRRCRSAPPPRVRNPITWENADVPDWR